MTSLNGLENLTTVDGHLGIEDNDALTSLTGLENIITINEDLVIGFNNSLASLNGLENLTTVGNDLVIGFNNSLTSLNGLENLTSVGNDLGIIYNTSLTSLTGLNNLTTVSGDLYIDNNDALTNLCALYNVNLGGDSLNIYSNTVLSMDTAYALETQLINNGFTGTADIHDNNGSGLVSCENDDDADGILNEDDECEDTPADEIVNSYGCSIEQLVPCEGNWRNHGKYVSALAKTANEFMELELITEEEKDALMEETASSDCGK